MSNLKVYAKTIEDEALEQINTLPLFDFWLFW